MSPRTTRTVIAIALQSGALMILALAVLGVSWLDARTMPRMLVLVDRSLSMPRAATDAAVSEVLHAAKKAGHIDARVMEFAAAPAATSSRSVEPAGTNIERALDTAVLAHAQNRYSGVVVVSDGFENAGDALHALRSAREAALPVHWLAVGRPPPQTRIVDVRAPDRVAAGQRIQLGVQLAGRLDGALRVVATARDASGATQTVNAAPDTRGAVMLELGAKGDGAVLVDVAVEDAASGERLDTRRNAAAIDVAARSTMLYVQGSPGSLAPSLLEGGWTLNVIPATRLDAFTDRLSAYRGVVLDDVSIFDASAAFWSALASAVQDHGIGLMVLGGERSFARGGYRNSVLESVLPVLSEPAALDEPASVVFVVDKSGSMGAGSAGVDRFRLAQRAVIETARGLSERDSLGLIVFDVEPRVLIPLGAAGPGREALERGWQASPRGGTKLAPALDVAIGQLERSAGGRRMLVIVTDGFVDNAPLAELRARLDRARIETIALAVGPDADAAALERLVGREGGAVLRVDEAAELPLVMRSGLERRRARIERGKIAVTQREPLPFAPAILNGWPPVSAYSVTRSRPQAFVPVQTERGDPLLAFQRFGQGRVVAVTSGLGTWTPQWIRWAAWQRLAGGLGDWISGTPEEGTIALAVSDRAGALQIEADVRSAREWADPQGLALAVKSGLASTRALPGSYVAPGRIRAVVPDDGSLLYTFVVSGPAGTQRLLHVRRNQSEEETWGTSPAIETWRSAGLIEPWNASSLSRYRSRGRSDQPDRWLVGAALALFLAGTVAATSALRRRDTAQ